MKEDQVYPITETKLLNLKLQGIVPFSNIAQKSAMFACGVGASVFFFNSKAIKELFVESYAEHGTVGLDLGGSTSAQTTLVSDGLYNALSSPISSAIALGGTLFVASLAFRMLQTGGLRLPLGRYPLGNLRAQRKYSIKSFAYQILGRLILFALSLILLYLFHSELPNTTTFDLSQWEDFQTLNFVKQTFLITTASFATLTVGAYLFNQLSFFDAHKMSQQEILEEGKE